MQIVRVKSHAERIKPVVINNRINRLVTVLNPLVLLSMHMINVPTQLFNSCKFLSTCLTERMVYAHPLLMSYSDTMAYKE